MIISDEDFKEIGDTIKEIRLTAKNVKKDYDNVMAENKKLRAQSKGTSRIGFSRSGQEELFMYFSIITGLIALKMEYNILAWVCIIKVVMELIASMVFAYKERAEK